MLTEDDKKEIGKRLAELTQPITVKVFTQKVAGSCQYCTETETLLRETCELSDQITFEEVNYVTDVEAVATYGIDKIPATVIQGETDPGIRFYGIPAGYEFAALLDTLIMVSQNDSDLPAKLKADAAAIDKPVKIQVFGTPTCPYCPRAALTAAKLALANPLIQADIVEVSEYPHLAQKYGVMGVPKIVVNEDHAFEGAMPDPMFLDQVKNAVA